MGSRSVNPPLSPADARECARRYAAGEPLAALTQAFRVWTLTVKAAVKRYGVSLRPEDRVPRVCRLCGQPAAGNTKRLLCAAHIRRFCSRCEDELPEGRSDRWCAACQAAQHERLYARRNRPCPTCATGVVNGRACRCPDCLHADYEADCRLRATLSLPCRECGVKMPRGRRGARCVDCQRRRVRDLARQRRDRGDDHCRMCGAELGLRPRTYCRGCETMLANWRRSYHAGCTVAARFGTVAKRQRRQEEKAA